MILLALSYIGAFVLGGFTAYAIITAALMASFRR